MLPLVKDQKDMTWLLMTPEMEDSLAVKTNMILGNILMVLQLFNLQSIQSGVRGL